MSRRNQDKACTRCCGCGCCFLWSGFFFLLALRLIFWPSNPRLDLADIRITQFSLSSSSDPPYNYFLTYDMDVTVRAHNPNGLAWVRYSRIQVELFFLDIPVGRGQTPRFHQGPHSNVTFPTISVANKAAVTLPYYAGKSLSKQLEQDVVWLSARINFNYRFQRGGWVSWRCGRLQSCDSVTISPPKAPWDARLLGHACYSKDQALWRQKILTAPCQDPDSDACGLFLKSTS